MPPHPWLTGLFTLLLLLRFIYPFICKPTDRLTSDMARHWHHGLTLFDPDLMASMDPKLYQVWVALMRWVTNDAPLGVSAFNGFLCLLMPLFWYLACRELFSRKPALILAIVIAMHPSFLIPYRYILTETLMMVLIALGCWLTLRAKRVQRFPASLAACLCLGALAFTRANAIPIAAMLFAYLMAYAASPRRTLLVTLPLFIAATLAASWHSYRNLYYPAPFYFSGISTLSYYSNAKFDHFNFQGAGMVFSAPVMHQSVLWPFYDYAWRQRGNDRFFQIDLWKGKEAWDKAIADTRKELSQEELIHYRLANTMLFFTGSSWPDAQYDPSDWTIMVNFSIRWMWAFVILWVFFRAPVTHGTRGEALLLLISLTMCVIFLAQSGVLFDARFRKTFEPMLLICSYIAWRRRKEKDGITVFGLSWEMARAPIRFFRKEDRL